jgi:hypothetical protein
MGFALVAARYAARALASDWRSRCSQNVVNRMVRAENELDFG